ncbi:MAG TPA: Gfo/Idh/MocA family oxidoreductase [Opitutaceae bacterium]|nr:Gfo/Idh/MocA family oxidoreductase [Opitutaceae bacterium]
MSSARQRPVGYAVVGLGHIAQVAVLPAFRHARGSRLVALVSGNRDKLAVLGRKYRVARTYLYDRFDACLADPEVEAVYIALPNDLHLDFAVRAAAAGRHVLCEKPLALDPAEAREMIRAAMRTGVKLMTAYRLHYEPATLAAIQHVKAGRIGEIRYFNSSFSYQVTDPRNIRLRLVRGGGPLYDIGIYCINAARYLMQDEPVEVTGMLSRSGDRRFREVEETAAAILRFPGGRVASFVVSFGAADVSRCELVGTKGRIVLEPAFEYAEALRLELTANGRTHRRTFRHTDQFAGEIEAFSQAIRSGRVLEPSGREGLADLRIIEAIVASDRTGRSVRLAPFRKARRPSARQRRMRPATRPPEPVEAGAPHE